MRAYLPKVSRRPGCACCNVKYLHHFRCNASRRSSNKAAKRSGKKSYRQSLKKDLRELEQFARDQFCEQINEAWEAFFNAQEKKSEEQKDQEYEDAYLALLYADQFQSNS